MPTPLFLQTLTSYLTERSSLLPQMLVGLTASTPVCLSSGLTWTPTRSWSTMPPLLDLLMVETKDFSTPSSVTGPPRTSPNTSPSPTTWWPVLHTPTYLLINSNFCTFWKIKDLTSKFLDLANMSRLFILLDLPSRGWSVLMLLENLELVSSMQPLELIIFFSFV